MTAASLGRGGVVPGLSVSGLNESYFNSNYIPEFGALSILILTISILAIVISTRFSKARKIINI